MRKCTIGGQAVLEGVMMKAPHAMAVAVRRQDGTIEVTGAPVHSVKEKYRILKAPILRGIITFGETLALGVKSLMTSAEIYGGEAAEEYKPSRLEAFIAKKTGRSSEDIMIFLAVVLAVVFALALFVGIPALAAAFIRPRVDSHILLNVIEGIIRLAVFMLYIVIISRMKDIQRVFEYHGAEHKTIHCYEHEEPLCVENARRFSTLHPRCGTAFLLIVMVTSIFIFSFLGAQNLWMRMLSRILLLPFIAGISFEVTRWAGRSTSRAVSILMYPGLMLQKLTTREPDDAQLEVAIQAFLAATAGAEEGVSGNEVGDAEGCSQEGAIPAEAGCASISPSGG